MQLATEAAFLEAALQVVEPAADMLPDNQARAVEKLAFDWIISVEKYVGPQYPELGKARDKVATRLVPQLHVVLCHCLRCSQSDQ